MVLPESEYREGAPELSAALSAEHVQGVYEERMPLAMHAALTLGCVVTVIPGSRSKALGSEFHLSDFQVGWGSLPTLPDPHLDPDPESVVSHTTQFLQHATHTPENHHTMHIFPPISTSVYILPKHSCLG